MLKKRPLFYAKIWNDHAYTKSVQIDNTGVTGSKWQPSRKRQIRTPEMTHRSPNYHVDPVTALEMPMSNFISRKSDGFT